jgi:hypothetical protein
MFDHNLGDTVFDYPVAPHEPPLSIDQVAFPTIIDNSMCDDFRKCEMRWFYKHCRKLALLDENVHLVAGGAYARGLEVTRRRFFDDGWPIREALRAGIRAAIVYYGPFEPHGRHTAKNVWRVIGAMEHHFNRWPIDSRLRPYKPEGADRHAIEFSFAEPIPGVEHPDTGEPLLYSGKCDFIGIDLDAGILGPVDDKTTTSLGDYWLSKWDLSAQMYGYIWASRRAGYPSVAAFIRGVSILKTKYGDADARTYATEHQLKMWEDNLTATVRRMISCYECWKVKFEHPFQMALGGACTDFGGCAFKTLCESDTPEIWIPVHFTVNRWNPLESRD